jgi:hypothetical protein
MGKVVIACARRQHQPHHDTGRKRFHNAGSANPARASGARVAGHTLGKFETRRKNRPWRT